MLNKQKCKEKWGNSVFDQLQKRFEKAKENKQLIESERKSKIEQQKKQDILKYVSCKRNRNLSAEAYEKMLNNSWEIKMNAMNYAIQKKKREYKELKRKIREHTNYKKEKISYNKRGLESASESLRSVTANRIKYAEERRNNIM